MGAAAAPAPRPACWQPSPPVAAAARLYRVCWRSLHPSAVGVGGPLPPWVLVPGAAPDGPVSFSPSDAGATRGARCAVLLLRVGRKTAGGCPRVGGLP